MLVTEDNMTEGDGLLLMQPGAGLGYQLAGAFLRLGRRTVACLRGTDDTAAIAQLTMPSVTWNGHGAFPGKANEYAAAFATPHPTLGLNRALSSDEFESLRRQLHALRALNPELHAIVVLPKASPAAHAEALLRDAARTTVLQAPALYGFRDGGLMDEALARLTAKPGTLLRPAPDQTTELVYAGDVAALLVGAVGKPALFGRLLDVPATTRSLEEWRAAFVAAFAPEVPWLEKIATRISNERPFEGFAAQTGPAAPNPAAVPALDLFPTVLTPLPRALASAAGHHRRNPTLGLLFPPSRGL